MDICIFTLTNNWIRNAVLELWEKGIKVRIISDDDQAKSQGSDVEWLRHKGIPVRTDKEKSHMHHKFCVIDKKILITGSFNWTVSAVKYNQENLVILESKHLCKDYTTQFMKLWK